MPMLTIHYSNRLEALADALASATRAPLASPFSSEVVVVQSRGVARWLSLRLADAGGVCANVRFPFPAEFAWTLYRALRAGVPEQSPYAPEVLAWRILGALRELEPTPAFAPVHSYVGGDAFRRSELARRLAALYDEYLVYRADWIEAWERGGLQPWQGRLWRRLSHDIASPHRAALHRELVRALESGEMAADALPERVSVFGAPALPPQLLELVTMLGRRTDVHLFVQNPCREYWGDIRDETDIARKVLARAPEARYLESGNNLLASMGKQGRDFFDLVASVEDEAVDHVDAYVEPEGTSLLAAIQADILALREPVASAPRVTPARDDRSIQVHSCHSAMREVEVLHDQLLALFEAHPDLQPSDVVVMTPDIETYAPYIEAVFGTGEPRIPYNVSDRSAEKASTLAATLIGLLELPGSRYEAGRVLALLDELSVQRRFGLSESDVEALERWVREAQIRWGIDAAHRASFGLPATHEHTWRFGLDRLLVGYAIPGEGERLFSGVLPYDEIEGSLGAVLGRFASFCEAAIALHAQLAEPRPVARWCSAVHAILAEFFDPPADRAEELEAVRSAVAAIDAEARLAAFADPVPLAVVLDVLRGRLEAPGRAFLSGGVTFCAMVPMRSLPFEVVCMIGMNDGAFPRVRRRDGFDLMAADFRKGDRSRRDDDRYLFLESLVSARRCLYMSYTGRHIREDTVKPPSVLVSELLEYVERGYALERDSLVTSHPLQGFSRRYFEGDGRLFSYSRPLCAAAAIAGRGGASAQPFITQPLPPPGDEESRFVDLETLIRFFRNPARHLLQRRLRIRLDTVEDALDAREPFVADSLGFFDLKTRLVDLTLRGEAHDGLALARAGGVLPPGRAGEVLYDAQREAAERLAAEVRRRRPRDILDPAHFEFAATHVTLAGALARVTPSGLFDYRAAKANVTARMQAWIRHLVLNALRSRDAERVSRCVTEEGVLVFDPVDDARDQLCELLDLYWLGQQAPLHFFPRTSCAYAAAGSISHQVRNTWSGAFERRGECDDPYYALAFRAVDPLDAEFEHAAHAMFGRMNEALHAEPLE
jgi:exodeoxyribonuclease V gamma subunit